MARKRRKVPRKHKISYAKKYRRWLEISRNAINENKTGPEKVLSLKYLKDQTKRSGKTYYRDLRYSIGVRK